MKEKEEESGEETYKVYTTPNFNTLFLGYNSKAKNSAKDKEAITNLLEILVKPENKLHRHEALKSLKSNNGKSLLVHSLTSVKDYDAQKALLTACWESGLDFSEHLDLFTGMAVKADFEMCLDLLTIIEEMNGPIKSEILKISSEKLKKAYGESDQQKATLIKDMLLALERF